MKTTLIVACFAITALSAGCAPYQIVTPDGMIALNETTWSPYDYRATTPDGVVVGVRQVRMRDNGDTPPADLEFWVNSLKLRLRTTAGYALLDETTVTSADGTDGVRLEFGRDEEGRTYRYDVTLFVTDKFVHVIESGGAEDLYLAASDDVEAAVDSYSIRR